MKLFLSVALVFACLLCVFFLSANARRRDLSEIRYRFTTCGATGRTGPSEEQCEEYYEEAGSILAEEGGLFQFHNMVIQQFNVPTTGLYNFTVAGASGGRGVCNPVRGRGIVVSFQSALSDAHQLLILVGQKGGSPCDEPSTLSDLDICQNQTLTSNDTLECTKEWFKFVSTNYSNYTDAIGGGGGGGASVVWPIIGEVSTSVIPLVVAGGGGGSSAVLGEQGAMHLCRNMSINCTDRNSSSDDVLSELYQDYTDGRFTFPNNFSISVLAGTSGARMNEANVAGVGGGWNGQRPSDGRDGEILNTTIVEEGSTARGGFDCSTEVDLPFSDASGGFGGGGGGCGGGGGGGGFFGGDVLDAGNDIPGRGGSSQVLIPNVIRSSPEFEFSDDSEDGFIEILPGNCNCVHVCMLYEEDDEFECLCPDGTTLALDESDCYKFFVSDVEFKERNTTDAGFNVVVYGLGATVLLYSMEAILSGVTSNSDGEQSCAIVFFSTETDSGGNVLLLASDAVKDDDAGVVTTVARVGVTSFVYDDFLSSTFRVSGAILLSTGECVIEDLRISMNISIRSNSSFSEELELEDGEYDNIIETLNDRSVPRMILRIGPRSTEPTSENIGAGATAGLIIAGLAVCVLIFLIVIMIWFIKRRGTIKSAYLPKLHSDNDLEVHVDHKSPYVSFTAAYQDQIAQIDRDAAKHTYETVGFGKEGNGGYTELAFTPRFGISAPEHDFSNYNRERANTVISGWNYPRSKLIYMREIGEGQFGKVLLMKAQGIAGYTAKIPVAVKTLTSREPEVVRKFMEEADLMKTFSHPNIVSLLGICSREVGDEDEDSAPLMILEYMQHGDMQAFLQSHRLGLNEMLLRRFARDIASAMEFLAQRKYVHRDLAARNCLVGPCLRIKIADFGLARGVHDKDYYRVAGQAVLPVRWMAPECLLYGIFTAATDVWAYGVVLWEIMMYGEMPFDELEVQEIIKKAQNESLRHPKPENAPEDLYDVMCLCHKHEAKQRPSFTEILAMLTKEEEEEEEERASYDEDETIPPFDEELESPAEASVQI